MLETLDASAYSSARAGFTPAASMPTSVATTLACRWSSSSRSPMIVAQPSQTISRDILTCLGAPFPDTCGPSVAGSGRVIYNALTTTHVYVSLRPVNPRPSSFLCQGNQVTKKLSLGDSPMHERVRGSDIVETVQGQCNRDEKCALDPSAMSSHV